MNLEIFWTVYIFLFSLLTRLLEDVRLCPLNKELLSVKIFRLSFISRLISYDILIFSTVWQYWLTLNISVPDTLLTSEDECKWFWHQMIYFPGTINIVSIQLYCHAYITMNSFFILQLCMSTLTLCMLAFWSREGVVFIVLSSPSHLTVSHVFPLPMSGANWRSLSLLWGLPPPSSNMAPLSTGSAHTPFSGYKTIRFYF
jgi:hypothetical protein